MSECPHCHFLNEDGAVFCEQCKSDLAVEGSAAAPAEPAPEPTADTAPMETVPLAGATAAEPLTDTVPLAALPVAAPVAPAEPVLPRAAEPVPVAEPAPEAARTTPVDPPAAQTGEPAPNRLAVEGTGPRLIVLRGLKVKAEYRLCEGLNYIGRTDELAVDIDLEDQEPADRVWVSRQHAVIICENGVLHVEDIGSTNGTFINRKRILPGQKRPLQDGDVLQIGTVQLHVTT
jgi:hypothetical protein